MIFKGLKLAQGISSTSIKAISGSDALKLAPDDNVSSS